MISLGFGRGPIITNFSLAHRNDVIDFPINPSFEILCLHSKSMVSPRVNGGQQKEQVRDETFALRGATKKSYRERLLGNRIQSLGDDFFPACRRQYLLSPQTADVLQQLPEEIRGRRHGFSEFGPSKLTAVKLRITAFRLLRQVQR